jgi:glutaconyl-CoA decarboxylase
MPGKIVDVFVEPGDKVDAGDVVLILEAMKMENELRAPKKATVKSVLVKKADPVAGGQLLVTLE